MAGVLTAVEQGSPAWIELIATEISAAQRFYSDLLGWQFGPAAPGHGGYTLALLDGDMAAGIGPKTGPAKDEASVWTPYLSVLSTEGAVRRCKDHGAAIVASPRTIPGFGSMALLADDLDAVFGVFTPEPGLGLTARDRLGALCWTEIHTTDRWDTVSFYSDIFGYGRIDTSTRDLGYTVLTVPGSGHDEPALGVSDAVHPPAGAGAAWMPFFGVKDCDDAADVVRDHGGSLASRIFDSPQGKQLWVRGPEGEAFGVFETSA